jgi:hypothetical protein
VSGLTAERRVSRGLQRAHETASWLSAPLCETHSDPYDPNFSYRIIGSVPGLHGGRLKCVQNESGLSGWMNHEVEGRAEDKFSGDPLWNQALFGRPLSSFFGLIGLNETTRLQPSATEANAALDLLDEFVSKEFATSVRFYEPVGLNSMPHEDYMCRFTTSRRLPIALHTFEASHDVNFHLASVFLPLNALKHLQAEGQVLLDFRAWLVRKGVTHKPAADSRSVGEAITHLVCRAATSVDDVTGAAQIGLNNAVPPFLSRVHEVSDPFLHWVRPHYPTGRTPRDHLRTILETSADGGAFWTGWREAFEKSCDAANLDTTQPDSPVQLKQQTVRRLAEVRSALEAVG